MNKINLYEYLRGEIPSEKMHIIEIALLYVHSYENNLIEKKKEELYLIAKKMTENLREDIKVRIFDELKDLTVDEISEYMLKMFDNVGRRMIVSSDTSVELVYKLLKINSENDVIMDIGSGAGAFLANLYIKAKEDNNEIKNLWGMEINSEHANISEMILNIISKGKANTNITISNALDSEKSSYNKAYVFPPIGEKTINEKTKTSKIFSDIVFSNKNSSEWCFIDSMLSGSDKLERAVALVPGRVLFNDSDLVYRNRLIENGMLEGIIELPSNVLASTGIKTFMLIFSKNNKKVKIMDASDLVEKKTFRTKLNVDAIMSKYENDEDIKEINELIDRDNLTPGNILLNYQVPKNGVKLSEVAEVFTGSQYTGVNFRTMFSDENTGYSILTSSDIEEGFVNWDNLQSIKYEENKFDKYAIEKNDIILACKSSKIKTAVVDIKPKEKILVTGGMIIIRPDVKKINPIYLKVFFDSEEGALALKRIQKGEVIFIIRSTDLAGLVIPLIEKEKQDMKAMKYTEMINQMFFHKKEIKRIENELKGIYSEK